MVHLWQKKQFTSPFTSMLTGLPTQLLQGCLLTDQPPTGRRDIYLFCEAFWWNARCLFLHMAPCLNQHRIPPNINLPVLMAT